MLDALYSRRNPLYEKPIQWAIGVSLLVHVALLLELPQLHPLRPGPSEQVDKDTPLTVRLAPPFFSLPASPASPPPPAAPRAKLKPPPPVVALAKPAPGVPAPPSAPAIVPMPGDLMEYIEAQRRARGEPTLSDTPSPRVESDNERASRIAAANLAPPRQLTFGYDPSRSGGVFTIVRLGYDYAEFSFIGWNSDIRRRTKQLVEVRKGGNSDIRIAVVRKMISIIREQEPVQFDWDSRRLGRTITLSSRMRDNAGLEDFMLQEFFSASP